MVFQRIGLGFPWMFKRGCGSRFFDWIGGFRLPRRSLFQNINFYFSSSKENGIFASGDNGLTVDGRLYGGGIMAKVYFWQGVVGCLMLEDGLFLRKFLGLYSIHWNCFPLATVGLFWYLSSNLLIGGEGGRGRGKW